MPQAFVETKPILTHDPAPAIYIQNVKLTFSLISSRSFFFLLFFSLFLLRTKPEDKKIGQIISKARLHNPHTGKTLIKLKAVFLLLLKHANLLLHYQRSSPLS